MPNVVARLIHRPIVAFLLAAAMATTRAAEDEPNWLVRVWKMSEGLGGTNVSGLAQTDDGFLWVVAGGELARFDGDHFTPFPVESFAGKPGTKVREFVRTKDGGLAFALYDGRIVRVRGGEAHVLPVIVPYDQVRLEALTEDTDGSFLVVYNDESVWRVREEGAVHLMEDGLPPGAHCRFTRDRDGRLWFAKGDCIGVARDGRFETLHRFPASSFARVAAAHDGGVWVGASAELYHFAIGGSLTEVATVPVKDVAVRPTYLLEDREGAVWFGTYGSGLFRYDGTRFGSVPISHRQAASMMEDREGTMWVATSGGGLDQIQPRALLIEGGEIGVPYQAVQGIVEDPSRRLWGFTQNGVIVSRHDGAWQTVDEIKTEGEVSCISIAPDGALWIGTKTGVLHRWYDHRLATWKQDDGIATFRLQSVCATREGDVWLGGARPASLQRLRAGKFQTFALPYSGDTTRAIAEDAAGNVWVAATGRQLVRITPDGRFTDESSRIASVGTNIRVIVPTADGSLWLSFDYAGIGRLRGSVLQRVTAAEGLPSNHIEMMIADDKGGWWLAGGEALFQVTERALIDVFEGRAKKVEPIRYGLEQGLRPVFGEAVGPLRRANGKLWIPMATSVAIVDPAQVHARTDPPPVWITRIRVDGRDVAAHEGVMPIGSALGVEHSVLRLPPDHRRVEIDFSALSFRTPTNVVFRYRLDPFDDHWNEAGSHRNVSYSRLTAGTYRFRVIACNSDGVWNDAGAIAVIQVAPFFWATWWFQATMLLAFAAVVFALARFMSYRRLQLKLQAAERETAVERERARIARDIHDDLGSRLTRIMMLSGLVKRDRSAPEKAAERVDEISETARQVLKSLDETVWAVDPRNDNLPEIVGYLAQFAEGFLRTAEIGCELDLPREVPPGQVSTPAFRHELFLAVKEALTNIVRHAQATKVRLSVVVREGKFEVTILDNGRGFGGPVASAHADGLRNMQRRMEQVGGHFSIESEPQQGTRITLIAPWPPRA